tara:strand:+ start:4448 stop:4702 length:255 start_codon:yes stop_codon:yes gene_type:complete
MEVKQTTTQIFFKYLSFVYKLCIAVNGAASFTNPISAVVTSVVALSSVISSSVSDNNSKPAMKLINLLAINLDKAENNPKKNPY